VYRKRTESTADDVGPSKGKKQKATKKKKTPKKKNP
jgi:hypothetical protein